MVLKSRRSDAHGRPILPDIRGDRVKAQTLLDAAQPYQRPNGRFDLHPLWILNELGNIDKHRTPLLTLLAVRATTVSVGEKRLTLGTLKSAGLVSFEPLEENATLGFARREPPQDVHMDTELTTFVGLEKSQLGGGKAVADVLQFLVKSVRDSVVPSFASLF